MNYSEHQLRILAQQNPKELIRIITSPSKDTKLLVLGAEVLGEEVKDESIVIPAFRQLLRHSHAFVREAALSGISSFFQDNKAPQDILDKLKLMIINDPLPNNKELAKDLFEKLEANNLK